MLNHLLMSVANAYSLPVPGHIGANFSFFYACKSVPLHLHPFPLLLPVPFPSCSLPRSHFSLLSVQLHPVQLEVSASAGREPTVSSYISK